MKSVFIGSGVALVTPFRKDGSINEEMLEELVEYHCENQTDALIICGTTGESATLSEEERLFCIRRAVEFAKGRVPIIAGTGTNCTQTTVQLSKEAENCGADGVLVVTPYYNKPTQRGLIAHYGKIAENIRIPIILYNVGSRTGCNIEPETVAQLMKNEENIVAIKEASGNISRCLRIMELTKTDIYAGTIIRLFRYTWRKGVITVLANISVKVHKICENVLSRKHKRKLCIATESASFNSSVVFVK